MIIECYRIISWNVFLFIFKIDFKMIECGGKEGVNMVRKNGNFILNSLKGKKWIYCWKWCLNKFYIYLIK